MQSSNNSTEKKGGLGPRKLLELIQQVDSAAVELNAANPERKILEGVGFALRAMRHQQKGDTIKRDSMLLVAARELERIPKRRRGDASAKAVQDMAREYA
jgi:hypothetical protein